MSTPPRPQIPPETLESIINSMTHVYGPLPTDESDNTWQPPDLKDDCHSGRYLWTDAFGVLNFITLHTETRKAPYLTAATRLVEKVHDVLGRTRDGSRWLSDENVPLTGGLRIGKADETGDDGDGQYWHYLVLWVFALLRLSSATNDTKYAVQARILGGAMYKGFILNIAGPTLKERPRIPWKISMDGKSTLVSSEGNLDPYDGLVMFVKLKKVGVLEGEGGEVEICIDKGVEYCSKRVESKWRAFTSHDPLDLGMALWTSSWWKEEGSEWGVHVRDRSVDSVLSLKSQNYFTRPTGRLPFREFGTAMGARCTIPQVDAQQAQRLEDIASGIISFWEGRNDFNGGNLGAINTVMYAAALYPGAFRDGYFETD